MSHGLKSCLPAADNGEVQYRSLAASVQRPGGSLTLGGSDFRYDIDKAGKLVTLYSEEAVSGHAIVAAIDALQQAFPGHTVLLNPFVEQTAPSIEAIAAWPSRAIPAD